MKKPDIQGGAWIAPGAVVLGEVIAEQGVNIWYHAVIRGDKAPVTIQKNSNIQENAVIHVDENFPVVIGQSVTVGHGAILHGCTVGDEVLIGMGAIILNGAVIGDGCIVGAGALVTAGTVLPENSLVVGSPAKVMREVRPEEREATVNNALSYVKEAQEYQKM